MADINSVTILPSQPVQGVQQAQLSQGSPSQAVAINLPPGTILTGFIVNRDTAGNPILRTPNGDVPFATQFFLKIGSEVTLRVENTAGNTVAHLLSVDGQPPEIAETQSAFASEPDVIVGQQYHSSQPTTTQVSSPASTINQPSTTVTGTLVSQPQGNPSAAALPTGTQITFKIVSLAATPQAPQPAPATPGTIQSQNPQQQANPTFYAAYARAAGPAPQAPNTPIVGQANVPVETQQPAPQENSAQANPAPVATTQPVVQTPTDQPVIETNANATPAITTTATATTQQPPAPVITNPLPSNEPSPPQPAQVSQQTAPIIPQPATKNPLPTTNQPAQAIPTQTGQIVTANVIGHEPTDESLLQTPIGTIRLAPGTTLPPRSTATLEITQITPPAAQNTTGVNAPIIQTSPPTATLPQLAQQWSALQQIFDLLAGRPTNTGLDTPPAPPTPNATNTPTPQPTITPQSVSTGLMSFIAALRSGNFDDWLGKNNVKWLQDSGHTDVLQKAAGEFTTLATQFTAPPTPHQWQSLFFPVAVEGQLQQVRMYTKRDRKQDGGQGDNQKNKGGDDTRFIIEVDLSKLGELQMDGFVRRADQSMQFDMIIRSLTALPKEIQQDILHIYNETGALTGYKGTLVFQSVKEFPVNPMNEIIASAKTVLA